MSSTVEGLDPFDILDAETATLERFFSSRQAADWDGPSRAAGWSVRDVLAHLAGEEGYNHACLDDELDTFTEKLRDAGVNGLGDFNQWCVDQRRKLPIEDVLAEWRAASGRTRRELRALGPDAQLSTMAGPYPVGLQTLHFGSEYATHADDVGAAGDMADEPSRTDWRMRFGQFALTERNAAVSVEVSEPSGRVHVELPGASARLSPAEFVSATVGRLPDDHPLDPRLREALRCLA